MAATMMMATIVRAILPRRGSMDTSRDTTTASGKASTRAASATRLITRRPTGGKQRAGTNAGWEKSAGTSADTRMATAMAFVPATRVSRAAAGIAMEMAIGGVLTVREATIRIEPAIRTLPLSSGL